MQSPKCKRRLLGAAATATAAVLLGGPPSAAFAPPASVVTAAYMTFLPGDRGAMPQPVEVRVAQGGSVYFANADVSAPHTFSSPEQPDGTFLFDTGHVNLGDAAAAEGVERLAPGTYPFVCRVHSYVMSGTLVVEPPGT